MTPVGDHTQNTTLSSIQDIDVPETAADCLMQATGAGVRITLDGSTDPTSTKGFLLPADGPIQKIPVNSGNRVRALQTSSGAKLDYQFIRG
jgi:hypothetical protein